MIRTLRPRDPGLLSAGGAGGLLSMEAMFPPRTLRDITRAALQRFFMKIPPDSSVRKSSMCIIGDQGCGKTGLLMAMYAEACRRYGTDRVHPIYTDDIRVALDMIDDRPVQLVMIDDAMTWASSRQVSEQTEIIKTYNRSRHVYEDKLRGKPGVILYIWAWQRFRELDPSFRQADVIVFKTGIGEPSEAALVEKFIGTAYYAELSRIWDAMNTGDESAKSRCVARITSQDVARGTGILTFDYGPAPGFPEMVRHEEYFADEDVADEILEEYAEKPEWKWRIEIYRFHVANPKASQRQIADALSPLRGSPIRQGYVSESLRKVRELISSK